jgi:ribosomal-protein-alanine N-acetyltransferase
MIRDYAIRFFEEKDLDEVVRINWTNLPENYDNAFFLNLFYHYPKTFVVAEQDGKIVGYMMGRIETGFSELKRFSLIRKGHVVSIAVVPEHRNKGIGSSLLEKALEGFKECQVSETFLEVRESNKVAIDLYQKFGFNTSRRIKGYYRDGETAFVMTRIMTT